MKNVWCCALVSVALTETITSGCCAASREDVFSARKDRQIGAVKIDEIYQV